MLRGKVDESKVRSGIHRFEWGGGKKIESLLVRVEFFMGLVWE